jgi:hypothetical protein
LYDISRSVLAPALPQAHAGHADDEPYIAAWVDVALAFVAGYGLT